MKRNLLLTLLTAALCVGCASRPVVQSRGTLQEVVKQGTTYHLDARRSGLGENEVRGLRDRLQKAGLSPASAEKAKLIVTLSSDLQSSTERQHTGGKNEVRGVRDRLQKAGLSPASAEKAKLIVTLSSDLQSSTERQHTGGKNGVAYDRQVNARRLTLTVAENRAGTGKILMEVSSADAGSASAETLLTAAVAGLGS